MERLIYYNDHARPNEKVEIQYDRFARINSKIEFFNADTGEQIWEPLHNKTVIAGSALMAQKLFSLDRSCLNNTPTYDTTLSLDDAGVGGSYPSVSITDRDGNVVSGIEDETQRKIIGFCIGQGGAGLDISDVFAVKYASWIEPDMLVPFRYPLKDADDVDENIYKGKKEISLVNGQVRNAYYFKEFSNSPTLDQIYTSNVGTYNDSVTASTVYTNVASADRAQTFVELHLKVTKDDAREYFIAHKGLENAKINQISLISAWTTDIERSKLDTDGNIKNKTITVYQDIRPFSLANIPTEILSDPDKSVSIIYTLYF